MTTSVENMMPITATPATQRNPITFDRLKMTRRTDIRRMPKEVRLAERLNKDKAKIN